MYLALKVNTAAVSEVQPERRQSNRHKLRGESLAICPQILGPVLDLSRHGMTFEYYGNDLDPTIQIMEMGIFISDSELFLTGLRARTVREQIISEHYSFLPLIRKIRAVEFLNPTKEQLQLIDKIIKSQSQESV